MFSYSWKHFQWTLTIGKVTMSLPLQWSQKESKIIESWRGKFRMLCLVFTLLTCISYLAFSIYHDLKIHGEHLIGLEDILIRYVYMMGGLMAVMLYGNLYHYLEKYMAYINEWIKLYNYIQVTYVRKHMRPWKLECDLLIQLFSAAYLVIPAGQVIHFIEFPESKLYGHWVFKDTILEELSYVGHILGILCGISITICAALFHAHIFLIPISVCFQTLRECRPFDPPFKEFPTTYNKLRLKKHALNVYRSFYMNFYLGNQCIHSLLFWFQSVATFAFVGCNCFLIRLGRKLNPKVAFILFAFSMFGTLLWIVLLHAAGLMHKKTLSWVNHWKRSQWMLRQEQRSCKILAKSLRPVHVNFSGLYTITLKRVVKYINLITRGTVKGVLVLFSKY